MTRRSLALVLGLAAALVGGCEAEKDSPEAAQRKAMCRQLMEHIVQITPRPGGGAPETDPARVQQVVAKLPVEDIEQCAAIKDPVKPGERRPDPSHPPKAIACMQAAPDVAALRAYIPAQTE